MMKHSAFCALILLALAALVHGLNLCYAVLSQTVDLNTGSWLPVIRYLRPELAVVSILLAGAAAFLLLRAVIRFFRDK